MKSLQGSLIKKTIKLLNDLMDEQMVASRVCCWVGKRAVQKGFLMAPTRVAPKVFPPAAYWVE